MNYYRLTEIAEMLSMAGPKIRADLADELAYVIASADPKVGITKKKKTIAKKAKAESSSGGYWPGDSCTGNTSSSGSSCTSSSSGWSDSYQSSGRGGHGC